MEDMGLIKSNVDKINSQLAKLPNVPQIETNKNMYGTTSRFWWTSDSKTACMIKSVAINGTNDDGCVSAFQDKKDRAQHALCIRTFSAGGAGKDPAQEKPTTYKVGDVYTNDEGVAIGTVFEIESGGTHGRILSRTSRTGTQAEAIEYCDSLNTSTGLAWNLPTVAQMVTVCKNKISGFAENVEYWTGTSNQTFRGIGCSNFGGSQTPTSNFSYFCAAAF